MIQFLQSYWQLLLFGALTVLEVIFFLLKKKAVINYDDHIKSSIESAICYYVKLAEVSQASGSEKLAFVVSMLLKRVKKFFGATEHDEEYWRSYIVERVEAILTTPQKKGS